MAEAWQSAIPVDQAGANPPQVGTPLSAPLAQSEAWMQATPVPAPPSTEPSEAANIYDRLTAVAQGYHGGTEGLQLAPDEAQWRYREMNEKGLNANEVVMRDPKTNQQAVYLRNPDIERGSVPVVSQLQGLAETAAPYMLPTEVPTAIVGAAMRPLTAKQQAYQDYQSLGIRATPPAVSPSGAPALASQGLIRMPFAGPPIREALGETSAGTAGAAERLAGEYGAAATNEEAGDTLQTGLNAFAGAKGAPIRTVGTMTPSEIVAAPTWATSVQTKADMLYDRANTLVDQSAQLPLTNTLQEFRRLENEFPSAPAIGQRMTNPTIRGYADDIEAAGGTLTPPEAGRIRSYLGMLMRDPGARGDIPQGDIKRAYGAMTDDLRANAENYGPDAISAFDRANQYYSAANKRLDTLEPLMGGTAADAFNKVNAASGTRRANVDMLTQLSRSMPPDEWSDVGAGLIRRMGQPEEGGAFSPSSFATNWKKVTPGARDVLFGENQPGSNREALEALARVAGNQQQLSKLQNVSHTAEVGAGLYGGMEVARHLWENGLSPQLVLSAIGAGVGAHTASRLLMSPGFARWLYGLPSVARGMVPGQGSTAVGNWGVSAQRVAQSVAMMARGNSDTANAAPWITNILGLSANPTSSTTRTQ